MNIESHSGTPKASNGVSSDTSGASAPFKIANRMMGTPDGEEGIASRVEMARTPDGVLYASEIDAFIRENAETPEEVEDAQYLKLHVQDWSEASFFERIRMRLIMWLS